METYWTADLHLGHANIIKYAKRPFSSSDTQTIEMNEHIIQEWNKIVKPGDAVWVLGDLCFKTSVWDRYAHRFNGQINVIFGNHDPREFKQKAKWSDFKFASVQDVKMIEVNGQRVFMSHFAHRVWPNGHHGAWHLYGHDHGTLPDYGMSTDVGVDAWNFKPVSFEELKSRFKNREPIKHH